jgi:hypothetical protein
MLRLSGRYAFATVPVILPSRYDHFIAILLAPESPSLGRAHFDLASLANRCHNSADRALHHRQRQPFRMKVRENVAQAAENQPYQEPMRAADQVPRQHSHPNQRT